jgi:CRISPR-associated Cas5-like protein
MNTDLLRIKLDVPVECRFTKADTFNGLPTYPIPPVTTVRGVCYAALNRPSLLNQDSKPYTPNKETIDTEREFRQMFEQTTRVSVQSPINPNNNTQTDLRKRMKVSRSDDKKTYKTYVAQEQSLISPEFIAYMEFTDESLKNSVKSALNNPQRLLYLGHSDDLVDISVSEEKYTSVDKCQDQIYAPINNESEVQNPILLPIKSDYKGTYSTRPAQSRLIGIQDSIEANKITYNGEDEFFVFFD